MSAIVKACNKSVFVRNTGKECDTAMTALAMVIAIHRSVKWTQDDLNDPIPWMNLLIHQRKAFPLFGATAPIRGIQNNNEADVTVTLDDGLVVFLRYGLFNKVLETTSGGLCYAKALQSFLNSGYYLIELDQIGQMQFRKNNDGTYSGLITDQMYAPTPIQADFRTGPYKNRFSYTYSPVELVNNGQIFAGADALLSMTGLIDVVFEESAAASTTKLTVTVKTECAGADLLDLFPTQIVDVDNFVITNKATGVAVVPSAIAIVGENLEITGTFVSAATYILTGNTPEVWFGNSIEGYDGSVEQIEIVIP